MSPSVNYFVSTGIQKNRLGTKSKYSLCIPSSFNNPIAFSNSIHHQICMGTPLSVLANCFRCPSSVAAPPKSLRALRNSCAELRPTQTHTHEQKNYADIANTFSHNKLLSRVRPSAHARISS